MHCGRENSFYFKSANEAQSEKIQYMQEFRILGFTGDRSSWSLEREYVGSEPLEEVTRFIDLGTVESLKFLGFGWSTEEGNRTQSWSVSQQPSIIAKLPNKSSVELRIRMKSFIEGQKVQVQLNGRPITTWNVPGDMRGREYLAILDLLADERTKANRIEFFVEKSRQPSEKDFRKLGISVEWAKFE